MNWMYPAPFIVEWQIEQQHIDHYAHVNNVAYVKQLEATSWAHTNKLGLTIQEYQSLDRGMAISRHEIDYLGSAYLNDKILCGTWVLRCDKRLKVSRQFQFIRQSDQQTLLKAKTDFVCIALSSGKPQRLPQTFIDAYATVQLGL